MVQAAATTVKNHLRRLVVGTIMMLMWGRRTATAFVARPLRVTMTTTTTRRFLASDIRTDDQGRRIRTSAPNYSDNDDWMNVDDGWNVPSKTTTGGGGGGGGGWDDFDPLATPAPRNKRGRPPRKQDWRQSRQQPRDFRQNDFKTGPPKNRRGRGGEGAEADGQKKINLKALEGAGYDHLYGLSPVYNALRAQKREFVPLEDRFLLNADDEEAQAEDDRKPEAQFRPYLFLQERKGKAGRSGDKSIMANQVEQLAQELHLPVAHVDKGVLNTLSGNRPHQGCVLRCGKLDFEPIAQLPNDADAPRFWLVLDQIVDPQNLGALLRSAYFFGQTAVLVCAKNSAPPSPVVSASSAGALEDMTVYATNNLPRTLATAEQDGFRIIGASASSPPDSDIPVYDLNELPRNGSSEHDKNDRPTVLVLGSEGHGIRSLVANSCTEFVKIPGAESENPGVDSLNVSVTGGILLWHMLHKILG